MQTLSLNDQMKKLRADMHYHQQMLRVDIRACLAGRQKVKELGEQIRDLQKKIDSKATLRKKR